MGGLSGPSESTRLCGAAGQAHLQCWAGRGEGAGPRRPLSDPLLLLSSTGIRPRVLGVGAGRGSRGGVGGGAYRGGAGRENVITRSSLLKVRHRLAGNRVHGGGASHAGWGPGREAALESPPGRCQEPPPPTNAMDRRLRTDNTTDPLLPTPTTCTGGGLSEGLRGSEQRPRGWTCWGAWETRCQRGDSLQLSQP